MVELIHGATIVVALIIVAWTLDYDDEQEDKVNSEWENIPQDDEVWE
tara:strand:+ start:1462 stop:1602 length:141 start_codon:yes stop_codon:yes gene_type:complete